MGSDLHHARRRQLTPAAPRRRLRHRRHQRAHRTGVTADAHAKTDRDLTHGRIQQNHAPSRRRLRATNQYLRSFLQTVALQ